MERYDEGAYHCSRTGHANFRPALDPPRGLPLKPSSFSQLIKNFVSPDEPTSVTGGGTLCGSGMSAPKRPIRWRPHERPSVSAVNPSNRPVGTGQSTSVASKVILALTNLETGQPALALPASSSSFAWSAPGTFAFNVRWTAVMAKPSVTLSIVTSAVVSMCSAVSLASPRMRDRAIVKHPAWAAPMSSSGLVPGLPSKRLLKPYGYSLSAPLLVEMAPLPSLMPPCQTADPWVFISISPCGGS